MDEDFQAWQLERQLLAQRLMIFLVAISIFVLSFVQTSTKLVGIFIGTIGLVCCVLAGLYFYHVDHRLRRASFKRVEERLGYNGFWGRWYASTIFPVIFGLFWVFALIYVVTFPWLVTGEFNPSIWGDFDLTDPWRVPSGPSPELRPH